MGNTSFNGLASKDEQIRAWAVEQAILWNPERNDTLIHTAAMIERFVKDGGEDK